jgi:dephospho-CoA kinase
MDKKIEAKIIAFVGLPGTGKSAATIYLGEQGIPKVSFGDIVMAAVSAAGLEPTQANERDVREKMRLDPSGDIALAKITSQINDLIASGQHKIVLDGLGGWESYKGLRHAFPGTITVVAFTAQRHIRHKRLAQRSENPLTSQQVDERDYDEIETLNKGGVIAMADYYIFDNGSLEMLHTQIDDLLRQIEF